MPETSKYDYNASCVFNAGFMAARGGGPHNPKNSSAWKDGYAHGLAWKRGDFDCDDDSWVHDSDMESR